MVDLRVVLVGNLQQMLQALRGLCWPCSPQSGLILASHRGDWGSVEEVSQVLDVIWKEAQELGLIRPEVHI